MTRFAAQPDLDQTLARAAEGDAAAWERLVRGYSGRVYGLLMQQCGDPELAEEVTQATFVKVVRNLAGYQEQGRFEPWLFRIAMNLLRDEMRRRKRQAQPMDFQEGRGEDDAGSLAWISTQVRGSGERDPAREDDAADPAQRIALEEEVVRLRLAIAQLSPADQEILRLRHTAGLSFQQIAQTLDQPLGTVLARGHRVLAKLRRLLQEPDPQ